jgi:flavin reductase (DIM6/NTAB) family NADH-FMN oxidoreductase RutF
MKKSLGRRTMLFPAPVMVVGTYDGKGKPNAMTVAWGGICCSDPPCLAVSLRKATLTYHNIGERQAFTVSIPHEKYVKEVDFLGIASGKKVDKFAAAGLTPVRSDLVDAPFVGEFPMVFECRLIHTIPLGLHTQFIGEILDLKVDLEMLGEKDLPSVDLVRPLVYAPEVRSYHSFGEKLAASFSVGRSIKG